MKSDLASKLATTKFSPSCWTLICRGPDCRARILADLELEKLKLLRFRQQLECCNSLHAKLIL